MLLNGANVQRLYESCIAGSTAHEGDTGIHGFIGLMQECCGYREDEYGIAYVDPNRDVKPTRQLFEALAYAILGPEAPERMKGSLLAGDLREDASSAVAPGQFNSISAWNAAAAGLLEVSVLEGYRRAAQIGDQLASTQSTRLRQTKSIGHTIIGPAGEPMNPGQRHPRYQFDERFVIQPQTEKYGAAIEVLHEAIFFDQTNGGVVQQAEKIGEELGLIKEMKIIDHFIGVNDLSNTRRYNYRGTEYDTYQGSSPWINTQANPLVDFDDVDDSNQLFVNMTDQEKGEPIIVDAKDILVMPSNWMRAKMIFGYDTVGIHTQTDTVRGIGPNPLKGMGYRLIEPNVRVQQRIAAASGLNAGSNAAAYWYHGDFKGAYLWSENWSTRVKRASPSDYEMADQDIAIAIFANWMGGIGTLEPRKIVRNTN